MSQSGVVIIGAGECGGRAALALREAGYDRPITLIGDEPHAPYERPPLSKGMLAPDMAPKWIAAAEDYGAKNIELITGMSADKIDREGKAVNLRNGRTVSYDKLLLATGARPRALPNLPFDGRRVLALRTHADAHSLQSWMTEGRRVVILGGGFIGLELAATARLAGAQVTVLEGLPRVLMRGVPEALALRLQERHVSEGVDLRLSVKIDRIEPHPEGIRIHLPDAPPVEADILVVGIGAVPNSELAAEAGLSVDNGIVVSSSLQTSDLDIFAAGDCCNFPLEIYGGRRVRLESWRSAQEQGALAAANILGADRPVSSVPWFWSDQYDLSLQVAGLMDEASNTIERHIAEDGLILFHLAADGRLVSASGLGTGNTVARDVRLAEMLIASRAVPDPDVLRDPNSKLKSLLRAA
ncbi:MAG: Ferredoxin--NAD(+) reductase [Rhizobium sp.]|nr:Ferredoxin--NAD(+) reductase [Rhizobium sp.]